MHNNDEIENTNYIEEDLKRTNHAESTQTYSILDQTIEKAQLKTWTSVKLFFKNHVLGGLITLLIGTALVWYAKKLITLTVDYSVLDMKIENLSAQVDNLSTDSITHELLNIQIEALRLELSSAQNIDRAEIDNRIDALEQQIAFLKESKP